MGVHFPDKISSYYQTLSAMPTQNLITDRELALEHCSVEWHLRKSPFAGLLYSHACALGGEDGQMTRSIDELAGYFEAGRSTIKRAIRVLVGLGFLEPIESRPGFPIKYRVQSHEYSRNCRVTPR